MPRGFSPRNPFFYIHRRGCSPPGLRGDPFLWGRAGCDPGSHPFIWKNRKGFYRGRRHRRRQRQQWRPRRFFLLTLHRRAFNPVPTPSPMQVRQAVELRAGDVLRLIAHPRENHDCDAVYLIRWEVWRKKDAETARV
jgi:hypothetical protein